MKWANILSRDAFRPSSRRDNRDRTFLQVNSPAEVVTDILGLGAAWSGSCKPKAQRCIVDIDRLFFDGSIAIEVKFGSGDDVDL